MKTISMETAVLSACMFLWCSCSKTMDEIPDSVSHIGTAVVNSEIQNLSSDEIGVAVANAFSYATNLDQIRKKVLTEDKINVDVKDAEAKMIDSMEDIYGANFATGYYQLKQEMAPELESMASNMAESLKQLDNVDEADAPECVRQLIAGGSKRAFAKSMVSVSSAYQFYLNDFKSKLGAYVQSYLTKCIDQQAFVVDDIKSGMTLFVDTYKKTIDYSRLTKTEASSLKTAFSVISKNMANSIDYTVYSSALAAGINPLAVMGGAELQKAKKNFNWKLLGKICLTVVFVAAVFAVISVVIFTGNSVFFVLPAYGACIYFGALIWDFQFTGDSHPEYLN